MKKHLNYFVVFFITFNTCFSLFAQQYKSTKTPEIIRVAYAEITNPKEAQYYYIQVLKLALDKTQHEYGDYLLNFTDEIYSDDRKLYMVMNNAGADILWASVTPERQKKMQVIPVNLLRDYNNYRLLLISAKNKDKFKNIENLQGLQQLTSGSGKNWTSSKVLKANGIKVATTVKFNYLINMLLAGRIDFIDRGLHEIHNDIEVFSYLSKDLIIEQNIALRYQFPIMYSYFVHKNNNKLATRINKGLALAEADGSFLQLFKSIPAFQVGLDSLTDERVHIELDNSLIVR